MVQLLIVKHIVSYYTTRIQFKKREKHPWRSVTYSKVTYSKAFQVF